MDNKDLFGNKRGNNDWQEEWQDMPEFIQEKQSPYQAIIVRFDCEEEVKEFARVIGQKLTPLTKSLWYPFKSHWGNGEKAKYIDES